MTFHVHRRDEHRKVPWRNGLGATWEVASAPDPAADGPGAFLWRLSFAEVTGTAPFSAFPGVDRTITLVQGGPLRLGVDGVARELRLHEPFAFAGEARVESVAEAPSIDFNVMVLRGRLRASVVTHVVAPGADPLVAEPGPRTFVVVLDGAVAVVDGAAGAALDAVPRDVVRVGDRPLQVTGTGVVQVVRLSADPARATPGA
jgi:environmental stress-induced protein Ves